MHRRLIWCFVPSLAAAVWLGCGQTSAELLAAGMQAAPPGSDWVLVARLAHITDTHVVDEESPARFAGAHDITRSAWRPYESYSTQLVDGVIRAVNRIHASGRTIDFLLHTGDACDNSQSNELAWLVTLFDGGVVNPLTGPDDRPAGQRPPLDLDQHAAFVAQGLYRQGVHGDQPSIPWYFVFGNHDVYSIGVLPIREVEPGHRIAPLPLEWRPGWLLPVYLDPTAPWGYGHVTPADPGPPHLFEIRRAVQPNRERAYFSKDALVSALFATTSGPIGHGFALAPSGTTWYSVAPLPGLRLIGLDTTDRTPPPPGFFSQEGALSRGQLDYLRAQLDAAQARGELVLVATHHPSTSLLSVFGSEVEGPQFRDLLAAYPNVVAHLCGHTHRHNVVQRASYLEIETCATLDPPQEGRLLEIWLNAAEGTVALAYETFSYLDDTLPPLGPDPLHALRAAARELAGGDVDARAKQRTLAPTMPPVRHLPERADFVVLGPAGLRFTPAAHRRGGLGTLLATRAPHADMRP